MRAASLLAVVLGMLLLAGGAALGVRERSQKRLAIDHTLTNTADADTSRLEAYFERARSNMLLTAHNPAFRDIYTEGRLVSVRERSRAIRNAESALAYLQRLYPGSIGEICFIDGAGPENARYVHGVRAGIRDLSPDESKNPFFGPTFALHAGQVFQAKPYVSPDTHEWVISNSTPVPGTGFPARGIVHYEITVESFRRQAAALAGSFGVAIVDAKTGRVVVDSRYPQLRGAPLGSPSDKRFLSLAAAQTSTGTRTLAGHRSAFRRIQQSVHNQNDWLVVATDPQPVGSLFGGFGSAPLGMVGAGIGLLLLAGISFRTARQTLHAAAHTDALTGLRNRRQLMLDLDDACSRADQRFTLVMFDLDGFKGYNDSFGHLPGDALLRRLGQKLSDAAVSWGKAYRLGGDEFCVLVPLRERETPHGVASEGAAALSEEGEGFAIGASHGAVLIPDEARSPSDVLAMADLRMYASKQKGRPSAARQTTDALVRVQNERSPALGPHVSEVAVLADAVGRRMRLPEHRLHELRQTAELHDLGKMAIPDAILDKAGPLTDEEWRLIREHTIVGERVISAAPALVNVAKLVRASHEHFDGTGYPDRLAGEAIPLEARIVHASDAFCAMTQTRPYRVAMSIEDAVVEMRQCAGTQFDPAVVEVLTGVLRDGVDDAPRETGQTPPIRLVR